MSESHSEPGVVAVRSLTRQRLAALSGPMLAAVLTLVLDQLTKLWALRALRDEDMTLVPNLLYFDLAFNRGAAFSMFSDFPVALTALASTLAVVIAVWMWRVCLESLAMTVGLGLILGGAIGNLVDRIRFDEVTDFIRVHFAVINWSWPTFNIADSAICIGMAILLWVTFLPGKKAAQ